MVLVELIFLLLAIFLGGSAFYLSRKAAKKNHLRKPYRHKDGYVPPVTKPHQPKQHFRTHGLATYWHELGAPRKIGDLVVVNMASGKNAVYELANIESAKGTDWNWYDFEFVRYADTPDSPSDSPRSSVEN